MAALDPEPPMRPAQGREILVASLGTSPDWLADELGLSGSTEKPQWSDMGSAAGASAERRAATTNPSAWDSPPTDFPRPAPSVLAPGSTVILRPEVRHFVDRFQSAALKGSVELWLSRAGRYASMIREVLLRKGLPEDLLFMAMMESGFDPVASSNAGARGIWQFMATTARRYGLRVDRWLDERLDAEKSTVAAASYLRDLYGMFGSWHLAHAAYNAGEMRVARAIQELRTSDFWQLARTRHLSDETKAFVAATQALTLIGREPGRYGFSAIPDEPLRYDVVSVPGGTTLASAARVLGVSASSLSRLNPALRLAQTPPGQAYPLKVPHGAGPRLASALPGGPKVVTTNRQGPDQANGRSVALTGGGGSQSARPGVDGRTQPGSRPVREPAAQRPAPPTEATASVHVVRSQDTVKDIARRYGVTVGDIIRWNQLSEADRIFPGYRLRVASLARSGRHTSEEEGEGGFR